MRVLVMGAGAVGAFFGAKLARAGHEVWFISRGDRLRALRTTGIRVESIEGDFGLAPLRATNDASVVGPVDLVLFTVKSTQTRPAAEDLRTVVRDHTTVLAIQNGIDNEAVIGEVLGADRVVPGVAVVGVAMPEPGWVVHTNNGSITLGEASGEETERVRLIGQVLTDADIPAKVSTHIRTIKWRKLVWNAAFNPIAAITGCRVLELIEFDDTRELAKAAMREAVAVGVALGYDVAGYDLGRATRRDPSWALSKTSMLQDMERGRPTEIEALTGTVVRYGEEMGVPTPVSRTLMRLVKAKERDVALDE